MIRHQRIVIAGAGQAGGVAAIALRSEGFTGSITLIGQEAWPPYERPPLSKDVLAGRHPVERTFLRPAEFYAQQGIDLLTGTSVEEIDRRRSRLSLSGGATLPYDSLLLATGLRARPLGVPFTGSPRIHYLRDIEDCRQLQQQLAHGRRMVVVGAGLIGLEVAATARGEGCEVVVLEQAPQPLSRVVPPEVGRIFAALHAHHGVDLRCGTAVTEIEGRSDGAVIHTTQGPALHADIIVAGIGGLPNAELAQAAGLAVSDGIVTDAYGRTDDPAIRAAGDVARRYCPRLGRHVRLESWQNAQNHALAVARSMIGDGEPYAEVPWFWTDQYDLNFQAAGDTEGCEQLVWRGQAGASGSSLFYLRQGRIIGGACFNSGRDMRHLKQLIARHPAPAAEKLADPSVKLADLYH